MERSVTRTWRPRLSRHVRPGFTLVELVAVMIIVAVLAAVAVPSLGSLQSTRGRVAAARLVHDLDFARGLAVHGGSTVCAVFAAEGLGYEVLAEPSGTSGRESRERVRDPASNAILSRTLGSQELAGASINRVDFAGGTEVAFDWECLPMDSTESPLVDAGVFVLGGGIRVTVQSVTGLVSFD